MKKTRPKIFLSKISGKEGQIETMGLLVVVILISLILFFALSFSINNRGTEKETKQEFKKTQAISNIGTTLLESTGPCDWTIRELLTDCAFRKEIICTSTNQNSCQAANSSIANILDKTLDVWGYEYNLSISTNGYAVQVLSLGAGCEDDSNSQKEITPFGTAHGGSLMMVIKSCSK